MTPRARDSEPQPAPSLRQSILGGDSVDECRPAAGERPDTLSRPLRMRPAAGPEHTPGTGVFRPAPPERAALVERTPESEPERAREPWIPGSADAGSGYTVYLEVSIGEACMAHVAELPGCYLLAPDQPAALTALPAEVERFRVWLHEHGITPPPIAGDVFRVREVIADARPWAPNGAAALFAIDRRPLDDRELALHLEVLAAARADLLALLRLIPRAALDERAPGLPRTLRQTLAHLAGAEAWHISRLGPAIDTTEPEPVRRLVDIRARAIAQLSRHARADRDLVYVPRTALSDDPEESWTLRKVLRRMIEHELLHLTDVRACVERWLGGTGHE